MHTFSMQHLAVQPLRLAARLGLAVILAGTVAQGQTTNAPQIVPVTGAGANTNPPSQYPFTGQPAQYAYPLIDANGVVIWPTNFWTANGQSGALSSLAANAVSAIESTNVPALLNALLSSGSTWRNQSTNIAQVNAINTRARNLPAYLSYSNNASGGFSNLTVLVIGDSMAVLGTGLSALDTIVDNMVARLGCAGYGIGNYGNLAITTLAGTSSVVPGDTNWWTPYISLGSGGSVTYTNLQAPDGGMVASVGGVFYLAGPSEGSFAVQTNINGGAFATAFTVNASQAGVPVVLYTNISGLTTFWRTSIRVVESSGTAHIIGPRLSRIGGGEAEVCNIAGGGLNLNQLRTVNLASLYSVLTNLNPSVVLFSMKENGDTTLAQYTNNVLWLDALFTNALPNCDVVYVGPYPDSTDTNATYSATRVAESDALSSLTWGLGRPFINLERQWTYQGAVNLGLMADGTHLNAVGSRVAGLYALNQLNAVAPVDSGPSVTYSTTTDQGRIRSRVVIGKPPVNASNGGKLVIWDGIPGQGLGFIQLGSPFNNVGAISFTASPTLDLNTPSLMGDGLNTYLQAPAVNGNILFYNRFNSGMVAGLEGGVNTNGGLFWGNLSGALDQTVPAGAIKATTFFGTSFVGKPYGDGSGLSNVVSTATNVNTAAQAGVVTAPTGPNLVWKSDGSNIPGWRTDATAGSPTFDQVGSGANTTAAMTIGSGAKIVTTGTGVNSATAYTNGVNYISAAGDAHLNSITAPNPSVAGTEQFGAGASATGTNSSAYGRSATATGTNSYAAGNFAQAIGIYATALGSGPTGGQGPVAFGFQSFAQGFQASAQGDESIAIGPNSAANGFTGIAFGLAALSSGTNSLALGVNTSATNDNSTAVGQGAATTKTNQVMLGRPNGEVHVPGTLVVDGTLSAATLNVGTLGITNPPTINLLNSTNLPSTNILVSAAVLASSGNQTNYTVDLYPGPSGNLETVYLANTNAWITFTGTNQPSWHRTVLFRAWTNSVVSRIQFVSGVRTNLNFIGYVTNGMAKVINFYNADNTGTNVLVSDAGFFQ